MKKKEKTKYRSNSNGPAFSYSLSQSNFSAPLAASQPFLKGPSKKKT